MAKSVKVFPSFEGRATAIKGALENLDIASSICADVIRASMQGYIDEVFLATGKRDQATCTMLGKAIRESEVMEQMVMDMLIEKTTITNYAQGAMRALHFNLDWAPRLFMDAERKLPWSKKPATEKAEGTKGSSTDVTKAGKVTTTTRAEADKTLSKAFAQYRMIGMNEFVANMLDLALESLDGFKETVLDK